MVWIPGKYHNHRGGISEPYRNDYSQHCTAIEQAKTSIDQLLPEGTQTIAVGHSVYCCVHGHSGIISDMLEIVWEETNRKWNVHFLILIDAYQSLIGTI